jgi:hypothetical protein
MVVTNRYARVRRLAEAAAAARMPPPELASSPIADFAG